MPIGQILRPVFDLLITHLRVDHRVDIRDADEALARVLQNAGEPLREPWIGVLVLDRRHAIRDPELAVAIPRNRPARENQIKRLLFRGDGGIFRHAATASFSAWSIGIWGKQVKAVRGEQFTTSTPASANGLRSVGKHFRNSTKGDA